MIYLLHPTDESEWMPRRQLFWSSPFKDYNDLHACRPSEIFSVTTLHVLPAVFNPICPLSLCLKAPFSWCLWCHAHLLSLSHFQQLNLGLLGWIPNPPLPRTASTLCFCRKNLPAPVSQVWPFILPHSNISPDSPCIVCPEQNFDLFPGVHSSLTRMHSQVYSLSRCLVSSHPFLPLATQEPSHKVPCPQHKGDTPSSLLLCHFVQVPAPPLRTTAFGLNWSPLSLSCPPLSASDLCTALPSSGDAWLSTFCCTQWFPNEFTRICQRITRITSSHLQPHLLTYSHTFQSPRNSFFYSYDCKCPDLLMSLLLSGSCLPCP